MSEKNDPKLKKVRQDADDKAGRDAITSSISMAFDNMQRVSAMSMMIAESCGQMMKICSEEAIAAREFAAEMFHGVNMSDVSSVQAAIIRSAQASMSRSISAADRNIACTQELLHKIRASIVDGEDASR
ncbi:MAG: hypothetical protein KDJ48_13580 [Nitratireductor sp.]|nr:hypothetical protein [Nitratireductor sp.]MCB1455549.1 hypothetical protein [Nitratireductor sp.]MCB1460266.1 hypothetical protein [Nitratireductor sp.]